MIDTIYAMGDDAINNQASVTISPLACLGLTASLSLRISGFTTPEYKIEFYDINYKGYTISKPKPGSTEERTLSFTFRVDKYYSIYKMLREWGKVVYNHDLNDLGSGDIEGITRTSIIIKADKGPTWVYNGCIFESLTGVEFDQTAEGDPVTATLTLRYLESTMI